jgi:hypothetical protein
MNHDCSPNIRYAYEKNSIMAVRASKLIKKGEQIFNSYTKFLWGTQQRRIHLAYSKNFLCKCPRCIDATEFESYISALKCVRPDCDGVGIMLPVNPLVSLFYIFIILVDGKELKFRLLQAHGNVEPAI